MPDAGWFKGVDDAIALVEGHRSIEWDAGRDAVGDVLDELKELRNRGPTKKPEPTYEETWKEEDALREKLPSGSTWRHLKRGTTYEILNLAMFQDATGSGEHDMTIVVVYYSFARSTLCVRPVAEFLDGRFERVR